jgi:uncharacterized HAD superfamily protein
MQKEKLNKTWFIDIDGTIVCHQTNYNLDDIIEELGTDSHTVEKPIERSLEFLNNISNEDTIVLTTARDSKHKDHTIRMLNYYNIRYDRIMFDLRSGPRYLINDIKPPGVAGNTEPLTTAIAVNLERDKGIQL